MYDELIKRLRDCTAEQNGEKTLWCQAADAIENLDYIAQTYAETVHELEDKNRWIPVTERLPEEAGKYLVCGRWRGEQTEIWVCEFMTLGCLKGWANNAANPPVSHWMPLPEPPKEDEETDYE